MLVGPFEQERKHSVAHSREDARGHVIVCPGHDGNEIQHAEDPLPVVPVHFVERGEWEASGEGSCVDRRRERNETGEPFPESGAKALRECEEGKTVALGMANVTNLVIPRC